MRTIFVLGASELQFPIIKSAKKAGLYVYVLDYDENAPGIAFADEYLNISTIDCEAVLKKAIELKPDYIITSTSDMPVRTVAWVNEQLGRKNGISFSNAIVATNKFEMRKRMKERGVPIPDYYIVNSYEEFIKEMDRFDSEFIIKPVDNAASRGVQLINKKNENDYEKIYEYTKSFSRNGQILLEEYMDGDEVSVECFVVGDEVHILSITDKIVTKPPYFVELGHTEPSRHSADTQNRINELAIAAIKAIELHEGPAHVEIKITSSGVKLVEIAARLGGDFITSKLVVLSTGVDLNKCMIDSILQNEVCCQPTLNRGAAIRFIQCNAGVIKRIEGVEEALRHEGIEEIVIKKSIGEEVQELKNSNCRIGHVIATGRDADEAAYNCECALKMITVTCERDK